MDWQLSPEVLGGSSWEMMGVWKKPQLNIFKHASILILDVIVKHIDLRSCSFSRIAKVLGTWLESGYWRWIVSEWWSVAFHTWIGSILSQACQGSGVPGEKDAYEARWRFKNQLPKSIGSKKMAEKKHNIRQKYSTSWIIDVEHGNALNPFGTKSFERVFQLLRKGSSCKGKGLGPFTTPRVVIPLMIRLDGSLLVAAKLDDFCARLLSC